MELWRFKVTEFAAPPEEEKSTEQRTHAVCKLKADVSFNDGNEKQST